MQQEVREEHHMSPFVSNLLRSIGVMLQLQQSGLFSAQSMCQTLQEGGAVGLAQ